MAKLVGIFSFWFVCMCGFFGVRVHVSVHVFDGAYVCGSTSLSANADWQLWLGDRMYQQCSRTNAVFLSVAIIQCARFYIKMESALFYIWEEN